jgi:hypothetical protein
LAYNGLLSVVFPLLSLYLTNTLGDSRRDLAQQVGQLLQILHDRQDVAGVVLRLAGGLLLIVEKEAVVHVLQVAQHLAELRT